jgi:serine/threonine protein phosphatase PrpC
VLDEREAMQHEDRNIVNNHVGSRQMRIEIGPRVSLGLHDTLLLASDGLFDNLMLSEIVELIRGRELTSRAEKILQRALQRMNAADNNLPNKPDDLSVLMFRQRKES